MAFLSNSVYFRIGNLMELSFILSKFMPTTQFSYGKNDIQS